MISIISERIFPDQYQSNIDGKTYTIKWNDDKQKYYVQIPCARKTLWSDDPEKLMDMIDVELKKCYKNESIKRLREQDVEIEVKHKGILEVPEGKNADDLPLSHFEKLAKKKGLGKITKALNNLQVWNKNDDPKLSKWAGDMIDKLNKKLKKDESIIRESLEWEIVHDSDDDDGNPTVWAAEVNSDKYGKYIWIEKSYERGYDVVYCTRSDNWYVLDSFGSLGRAKKYVDDLLEDDELDEKFDRYDPNVEAQFMEPGNLYDDMPDEPYDTDITSKNYFNFVVNDVMNRCKDEREARRYMTRNGLPKSFIDDVIKEIDRIYDND